MPMFRKCSSTAVLVSTSIEPDVALEYPPEGLYLFLSEITAIGKELNDRGGQDVGWYCGRPVCWLGEQYVIFESRNERNEVEYLAERDVRDSRVSIQQLLHCRDSHRSSNRTLSSNHTIWYNILCNLFG